MLSDDETEDPGESTLWSDIEDDDLDYQQEVFLQGQAHRDKPLRTSKVPLPKIWSHADTVIACPPLPNSRNPAPAMAPALLKRQKSTILNKSSESDGAPSTQALPLRKSSGDQNGPQPKASADHNVPQHQQATFEVGKWFMQAIVFRKTPWPILTNDKYSMVEEAWKLANEAENRQRALAGTSVCSPSVWQLPSGPSLKIDLQTRETVSLKFCLMLLYHILYIYYAPCYTQVKLKISTIRGRLPDGIRWSLVRSYRLDLRSETELWIQVKELLFDETYLPKVVDDKKSWVTQMEVLDLI